jgi:hypothetical protein
MPLEGKGTRELARDASDGHDIPDDGHETTDPEAAASTLNMSSPQIPVLLTFLQAMRAGAASSPSSADQTLGLLPDLGQAHLLAQQTIATAAHAPMVPDFGNMAHGDMGRFQQYDAVDLASLSQLARNPMQFNQVAHSVQAMAQVGLLMAQRPLPGSMDRGVPVQHHHESSISNVMQHNINAPPTSSPPR